MPRTLFLLLVKGRSSSTDTFILEPSTTSCSLRWWCINESNCTIPKTLGSQKCHGAFAVYLKKFRVTERKNSSSLYNSDCNNYQKEIYSCFVDLGLMVFIWQALKEVFCVRYFGKLTNIYVGHLASDQHIHRIIALTLQQRAMTKPPTVQCITPRNAAPV